jgi:PAS domain S-box-containing protein
MKDDNKTKAELIQELAELRQKIAGLEVPEHIRKRAEEELRASRERYQSLFENVPISLWEEDFSAVKTYVDDLRRNGILDLRNYFDNNPEAVQSCVEMVKIIDVNQATLKLYRVASKQDLMSGLNQIFREETYDVFREQLIALAEGRTRFESERLTRTLSGDDLYVYLTLSVAPGHEDNWSRVLLSLSNITKRKQAEEELRLSEARLAEAQRIAHLGNWDWDIVQDKLLWSDGIYRIFSLVPQQFGATYEAFLSYVHPEDRKFVERSVNEALYERRPYNIDHRIVWPDSSVRVVHEKAEVTFDETGKPTRMIGTVHDITELKRAEEELRALSQRLVQIQEEERRTIARELHDQIGQSLTVLKLLLDKAVRLPPENVVSNLGEAQALVNELMGQVRDLSFDLRPGMLDDLGLLPTLLWHFDRFTATTQVQVNFRHSGLQRRFPQEVGTAAYRIVQEALTNVVRHAKVMEVAVAAWVDQDTLWIRIEDKGTGFDQSALPAGASGGLYGMRERARSLSGELIIESRQGSGTIITARLPFSDELGSL